MRLKPEVEVPVPTWQKWLLIAIVVGCVVAPFAALYALSLIEFPDMKPDRHPAQVAAPDGAP